MLTAKVHLLHNLWPTTTDISLVLMLATSILLYLGYRYVLKPLEGHNCKAAKGCGAYKGRILLPNPEPLVGFDLGTAMPRDFLYVNRTMRYPYHQVGISGLLRSLREEDCELNFVLRRWLTSQCISTTGSR